MTTRAIEVAEQQLRVPLATEASTQTVVPPMPFIFRYRGYAHPVPLAVSRTDPTAGE